MSLPKPNIDKKIIQSPRVRNAQTWMSLDHQLNSVIDRIILELNPRLLDAAIADALNDWDNRETAIEYLIEKLQKELKGE